MSSISTLEVAWEHYPWGTYDHELEEEMDETYFCEQVAQRINSSCSSGRERRKSVSGMIGRLMRPHTQGNLEMVKYCVANECPIDEWACANAAENGHLECLKYLREEVKAPWDLELPLGRLQMVISTYSNILLSVSMINIRNMRVGMRPRTAT